MTFAEIILFVAVLAILCVLMIPLQRYLEVRLRKIFRSMSRSKDKPVIDITDYQKKDKSKS
jgi:hypothetical protein